jgi:hypothetical protein
MASGPLGSHPDFLLHCICRLLALGVFRCKGGLLGVWGTHAPDWAAPALPHERAMRLWGHAASTGTAAISITILVILIMRYGTG